MFKQIIMGVCTAIILHIASAEAKNNVPYNAIENPYAAPEFTGIQTWLNSKPLTLASLKGKVVLIDFWTYSCINCIRTFPYITQWDKEYRDKGLVIIGVHAPEFDFEKNVSNINKALEKYTITYPIAIDNGMDTWNAFHNRYWPAHYLIDKEGNVVYTHFGEGNYAETENNIRYLLGLGDKADAAPEKAVFSREQTPETYLGSARAAHFASPEKRAAITQTYSVPASLPADHWALSGKWYREAEHITSQAAGAKLKINFTAGKVFLVLGTKDGKPVKATLTLNGAPLGNNVGKDVVGGVLTVKHHMLYELVNQQSSTNGLLEITALDAGLEAYAFTFGN